MENGNHDNPICFRNEKDLMGKTAEEGTPNRLVDERELAGMAEYALKSGVQSEKKF